MKNKHLMKVYQSTITLSSFGVDKFSSRQFKSAMNMNQGSPKSMDKTKRTILISNIVIALCIQMVPGNFTNFWEHNTHKTGVTA